MTKLQITHQEWNQLCVLTFALRGVLVREFGSLENAKAMSDEGRHAVEALELVVKIKPTSPSKEITSK